MEEPSTRLARVRAHTVFDLIWKRRYMVRHKAYAWMRRAMKLSHREAHISLLSAAQCQQLIRLVYRDFPQFQTRYSRLIFDESI